MKVEGGARRRGRKCVMEKVPDCPVVHGKVEHFLKWKGFSENNAWSRREPGMPWPHCGVSAFIEESTQDK